jgi:hypothetical protein
MTNSARVDSAARTGAPVTKVNSTMERQTQENRDMDEFSTN